MLCSECGLPCDLERVAGGEGEAGGGEIEVDLQPNGAEEEGTPEAVEDHGNEQNGGDSAECTPREEEEEQQQQQPQ